MHEGVGVDWGWMIGIMARGVDVDDAILILPVRILFLIKSNLSEVPWGGCAGGPTSAIDND
jgi:hypothetical protein